MYREAETCIDEVGRLYSPEIVADRLKQALGAFGCENAIFTGLPADRQRMEDLVVLNSWPTEYYKIYTEQRFVEVCPIARQCKRSILPFEWSEAPYDPQTEPRTAAVLALAADFGMARGLTVPVPIPDRHKPHRAVSLSGDQLDLSPPAKRALHLVAMYGFERLCRLLGPQRPEERSLTPREREVLSWAAAGKSAWEISETLNIAKRTVDQHSQSACRKLRAANRTHAVAIAFERKLIEP
jgi:LuxR family quorum sensing-dependent transcriptional regulator